MGRLLAGDHPPPSVATPTKVDKGGIVAARFKVLLGLLALGLVVSSLPRVASHAEPAPAVVALTDVPGKWFDPSVTVVPVGGSVEFRTTTFGATFTSAVFPCTPDSLAAGSCGLGNPASFPAGFPVDQPDPIT